MNKHKKMYVISEITLGRASAFSDNYDIDLWTVDHIRNNTFYPVFLAWLNKNEYKVANDYFSVYGGVITKANDFKLQR
jgi:hypothetical protein